MHYLVTAYRWGQENGHRYVVGVWTDQQTAREHAEQELHRRGGKYAVAVHRWDGAGAEEQPCVYLRSILEPADRTAPEHSPRLEYLAHIGAVVVERWERETDLEDHRGDWPAWLVEHLHGGLHADTLATRWADELQDVCEILAPAVGEFGGNCDTAGGFARRAAELLRDLRRR